MVMSTLRGRGGIFISYRREETAGYAGRLYDRLSDRFGEDRVFMDVDSIAIGVDFTRAVIEAVSACNILLALIGQDWSAITDSEGKRRIDNPDDFVRVEIETALQRDIRVVPVLVDGAVLPQADDLPPSLRPLTRRQALKLSHAGFRSEISRLVAEVDKVLEAEPDRFAEPPKTPPRASAPHVPLPRVLQVGRAAAFSPDGTQLATIDLQQASIWDLQTGAVRTLWLAGPVTFSMVTVAAVAFSPDGTRLAASSYSDKAARIWDVNTG
jgi:hypothetical protein